MENEDNIISFRERMAEHSLDPKEIVPDGVIHRFPTWGDASGEMSGAYWHNGRVGWFQDWRSMEKPEKVHGDLSEADRAALAGSFTGINTKVSKEALEAGTRRIWNAGTEPDGHPYLSNKGITSPPEVKQHDGCLIIPVFCVNGELNGLQRIDAEGRKRFLTGTRKKGSFFSITGSGTFIICEGFATGVSLYEATGSSVVAAFDAGNLINVAKEIAKKTDPANIIICGDDDHVNERNIGAEMAKKAAKAIGCRYVLPTFQSRDGKDTTDFNDLHRIEGLEAVRVQIEGAETVKDDDDQKKKKKNQTQLLLEIAKDTPLFRDNEDNVYANPFINGVDEFLNIRSRVFQNYLSRRLYEATGIAPYSEATKQTINILNSKGLFESPEVSVNVRVGKHDGNIYLDLGNRKRQVIKMTPEGWAIDSRPPIFFRRPKGFLSLPMPMAGGDITELRQFLNVRSDDDFKIIVGWLVQSYNPEGPYPVLVVNGEQGTAKSTLSRLLRLLVDPNLAPLRSLPRSERDLAIQCSNSWVQVIENVSDISDWLSNALCRLSTGGGFSTRQLYENSEESLFCYKRPLIINGISNFIEKQDLLDRSLLITLEPISEKDRLPESIIDKKFSEAAPYIIGALLDAVCVALKNIDSLTLDTLPRLADFAMWVVASEPGLPWGPGAFMTAYSKERERCIQEALENSPIGSAIQKFMEDRDQWFGTATELLTELEKLVSEKTKEQKLWPANARWLHTRIKETSTFLRKAGIDIINDRDYKNLSFFRIVKLSSDSSSRSGSEENQTFTTGAKAGATGATGINEENSSGEHNEANQGDGATGATGAKKQTSEKKDKTSFWEI